MPLELFVVLVILFIVFGAKTLPRIGEAIGRKLAKRRRPPEPPAAP
jgi:Sec-independent protein translocase protein TatA